MRALPAGTVTFLFSDVEGSTRLLQRLGPAYADVLAAHHRIVRDALAAQGGVEVDTAGDGFFAAFARATDAVAAAAAIQRALAAHGWPEGEAVRVRMGLHTGEPVATAEGYTGLAVHQAARLMGAAHGGQVLLSDATCRLVAGGLPGNVSLRALGAHALKDFDAPEPLAQLVVEGLPSDFPPPRTLVARPNNLPRPPTPLIGRDADVGAVLGLFRDGVRLVTLTGPGGSGKTRLAVEVAGQLLDDPALGLEAGAWFAALAPVSDPALVPQTVADALGAKEVRGRPVAEALAEHVGARPMLVVLDNFEQVLGAAPFVSEWLMACPALRVLATSRAALRLQGEREHPVPPLALPDPRRVELETLSQYAAVRLFVERAVAVRPDFRVDNQSAAAVAGICARLDGLPLAIELAAARVRLFPPEAMLARLARSGPGRLDLLRGGARDLPDRHQTLRDTVQWSYDLLTPEEQRLFRRLAAFVGGCALEAAEALGKGAHPDPAEGVLTLLDHSLLRRDEGPDGEPRFRMLETIREFGLAALAASGEEPAVREAHVRFFLALAEEAEPHLTGPGQRAWLDRLDAEQANLRAALDHLEAAGDVEAGLRMGKALGRFWLVRGHLGEGYRRLERLVALSAGHAPSEAWVAVRNTAGIMAQEAGDTGTALRLLEEVVAACRAHGDRRGLAVALNHLGYTCLDSGEVERARALCEEALALHRALGDLRGEAISFQNLGLLESFQGRYAEAERLLLEGLEKRRAHGEPRGYAFAHHWLSFNSQFAGRPEAAAAHAAEGLSLIRDVGDPQVEAVLSLDAAMAALDLDRLDEASAHVAHAYPLWERSGNVSGIAFIQATNAQVLLAQGRTAEALAAVEEALLHIRQIHLQWGTTMVLLVSGEVRLAAGDPYGARTAFEEALVLSRQFRQPRGVVDSLIGLGAAAEAEGRPNEARAHLAEAARTLATTDGTLGPRLEKRYGAALAAALAEQERAA
jgi:predicted ATPase/class 3 adenylate cyclase